MDEFYTNHHFQRCYYQTSKSGERRMGIAKVSSLDTSDVKFILDENGSKVKTVWDYELHPASHYESTAITLKV